MQTHPTGMILRTTMRAHDGILLVRIIDIWQSLHLSASNNDVLFNCPQDECELPQMHMLSVAMEPILHKSCPPNCQDMLAWLPYHVALHVLSFLDSGTCYKL